MFHKDQDQFHQYVLLGVYIERLHWDVLDLKLLTSLLY